MILNCDTVMRDTTNQHHFSPKNRQAEFFQPIIAKQQNHKKMAEARNRRSRYPPAQHGGTIQKDNEGGPRKRLKPESSPVWHFLPLIILLFVGGYFCYDLLISPKLQLERMEEVYPFAPKHPSPAYVNARRNGATQAEAAEAARKEYIEEHELITSNTLNSDKNVDSINSIGNEEDTNKLRRRTEEDIAKEIELQREYDMKALELKEINLKRHEEAMKEGAEMASLENERKRARRKMKLDRMPPIDHMA